MRYSVVENLPPCHAHYGRSLQCWRRGCRVPVDRASLFRFQWRSELAPAGSVAVAEKKMCCSRCCSGQWRQVDRRLVQEIAEPKVAVAVSFGTTLKVPTKGRAR